ncbi:MAG: hypothetical protein HEP70_13105 [Rhodobiaceae bacterium]|nr:hypothetical protein [Rhodobiaceae bacterium]
MPGPHYALSEAVLVVAALWAALRLFRGGYMLASVGVVLFGLAAAMGVWRFGTNSIDEWASVHRMLSLSGGVLGLTLIVAEMLRLCIPGLRSQRALAGLVAGSIGLGVITLLQPGTATPLFLVFLNIGIALAFMLPATSRNDQLAGTAWFAIFLLNVLLIRRSPLLEAGVSWHLYHLLIALWIVGVAWIFLRPQKS